METMFIIHEPGKVPRVGYPTGDEAASLREWQKHHEGAAIYVLQAAEVPPPGTVAVQSAEEFLMIDELVKEIEDEDAAMGLTPNAALTRGEAVAVEGTVSSQTEG